MSTLFVIRGVDQGTRFEIEGPILRIGRDLSNNIQLHDTEVSRQHAEIHLLDNAFTISDLSSSNGTYVNGQRIKQQRLTSGDQLQMGGTLMLFTGPSETSEEDLAKVINIGPPREDEKASRIVSSVSQEEGSRIFDFQADLPQNSWLARRAATCRSCTAPPWPSVIRWISISSCSGSWI